MFHPGFELLYATAVLVGNREIIEACTLYFLLFLQNKHAIEVCANGSFLISHGLLKPLGRLSANMRIMKFIIALLQFMGHFYCILTARHDKPV
jgi:hypothetical protein